MTLINTLQGTRVLTELIHLNVKVNEMTVYGK